MDAQMDGQFDWLNRQIDNMQAGKSLLKSRAVGDHEPSVEEIAMLRVAARLNSLRPGRSAPDAGFVSSLRERVLAAGEGG